MVAQSIFPNLSSLDLLDALLDDYRPATVLDYSDARDTMYARIFNVNDSVSCVYSSR